MSSVKLEDDIYWVGVKDSGLEVFDIIMTTKKGTTYNSYIINDDKVVVIDSVKDGFWEESFNNIKEIIGEKDIDYIVVNHTELDHSGSIKKFLEAYPKVKVIGTGSALAYLKEIVNTEFEGLNINKIGQLNTGKYTLKFIAAPNLHWPDTMFTYVDEKNILFSCDVTGAHYCPENIEVNESDEEYLQEFKYYFQCIMGPFKKFVILGLDKIKDLEIDMIAPSHGPIHIGKNAKKALDFYRQMSIEKSIKNKIQILYVSAYSNTENMAKYLQSKLNENGIESDVNDITSIGMEKAVDMVNNSRGLLIGSPTINQDAVEPAWNLLTSIPIIPNRGKPAGAFGSYGWSGEGVNMMTERLKSMKFKVVDKGLKFKFVPSEDDYKVADKFIQEFVNLIK